VTEILRTVVGSGVHGIAIEGTDDHDEMGVFIEQPERVLGLDRPLDSVVTRTQPEGHRSGPGDTDLVQYSLRHYMRLAVQGNPTMLLPLFADDAHVLIVTEAGRQLRALAPAIVSRKAGPRFLGYMGHQLERLQGTRRSKPNRPELVAKYGYDTKFASHALRLALQGIELMQTGRLTLPMRDDLREHLRAVKTGGVAYDDMLREATQYEKELVEAVSTSPLPAEPDYAALNEWMIGAHLAAWR
jgi:predicted nucleotidyltransferase